MGFIEKRDEVKVAREDRDQKKNLYNSTIEKIDILSSKIDIAKTLGNDSSALEAEKSAIEGDVFTQNNDYSTASGLADQRYGELTAMSNHAGLVQNLDENYPILLFPVKVEIRFVDRGGSNNKKLLVRIFPDDIAIETHELQLTEEEGAAGDLYWTRYNAESDEKKRVSYWNDLCNQYGHQRAAWIVLQTPTTPSTEFKNHSWTQQPFTRLMPDKFVVVLYDNQNNKVIEYEGASIPDLLKVGLDPKDDTTLSNDGGNLTTNSEISWMVDFDQAVAKGMGMEIPITDIQYSTGFSKLIAVGVRVSSDQNVGGNLIEQILNNHHYTGGLSILEQETSTNNGPDSKSGYSSFEFGNTLTHQIERESDLLQPHLTTVEKEKRDGQVFAEALGILTPIMDHIHRADGQDVKNAKKFGNMSFQAVIGHYFGNAGFSWNNYEAIEETRDFFVDYVTARGIVPSFRVGTQPYGVVPASVVSRMECRSIDPGKPWVETARDILVNARGEWINSVNLVSVAGTGVGDRTQDFLNMASSSAVSQNYELRIGLGPQVAWNTLNFHGADSQSWYAELLNNESEVINNSGLPFDNNPNVTKTSFYEEQKSLHIPFVQESPLSKDQPVENIPGADVNFFEWLSNANVQQILNEDFSELGASSRPNSLLYEVARYSILLDYWQAAANYKGLTLEERKDQELINVDIYQNQLASDAYDFGPALIYFDNNNAPPFSYLVYWEKIKEAIKIYQEANPGLDMQSFITDWSILEMICEYADLENPVPEVPTFMESKNMLEPLFDQIGAFDESNGNMALLPEEYFIHAVNEWTNFSVRHTHKWDLFDEYYADGMSYGEYLDFGRNNGEQERRHLDGALDDMYYCKDISSKECDLLLREFIDVASDRIDAWEMGLITRHLHEKRFDSFGNMKYGSYIGCYGWLESLTRNTNTQNYVYSANPMEQSAFESEFGQQVKYDTNNNGFLWAPSINQAVTGAILRSGYIQHANANQENMLATNLTSEKIRLAEEILDGVRNGLDLSSLLGYRFERLLHDASGYLDQYIADFRKAFPYPSTLENLPESEREFGAARNVLDGIKLVAAYRNYIVAFPSGNFADSIVSGAPAYVNDLVKKLTITLDAFGDYVVAEGMFLLAQGNPEAANAWTEAFSQGKTPPQGIFSNTPRTGITVSNRVLLKMEPMASGSNISWRALTEPSLNSFLTERIPSLSDIQIRYTILDESQVEQQGFINLADLKYETIAIEPIDLIMIINDNLEIDGSELISLIKEELKNIPSYSSFVNLDFTAAQSGKKSLASIYPFLRQLRRVVMKSRSLRPTDFNNPNTFNADYADMYNLSELRTRIEGCYDLISDITQGSLRDIIMNAVDSDIDDPQNGPILKNKMRLAAQFGMPNALSCETTEQYIAALKAIKTEYANKLKLLETYAIPGTLPSTLEESETFINTMEEIANIIYSGKIKLLTQFKSHSDSTIASQIPSNSLFVDFNFAQGENITDVMENWIHSESRVRNSMADLELLTVLSDSVQESEDTWEFRPFQIPYLNEGNDRWMALKSDPNLFMSNAVCLAILGDNTAIQPNVSGYHSGLFIDSWTETIPYHEESTGIGMHYDAPNAQAPQALLMAVSPTFDGNWSWDDLVDCVNETFEMAKERGVSYAELSSSYLGQLLPAVRLPGIYDYAPNN